MDEQKQLLTLPIPVMTQERFAELSGLSVGQVRGMVEKGHLPTVKCGNARPRFINLIQLSQEVQDWEDFR